jgi:hypothetical protein
MKIVRQVTKQTGISIRNRIAKVSFLFPLVLRALAPPGTLLANFLWFKHKASVKKNYFQQSECAMNNSLKIMDAYYT